jgi:hypothetical protein
MQAHEKGCRPRLFWWSGRIRFREVAPDQVAETCKVACALQGQAECDSAASSPSGSSRMRPEQATAVPRDGLFRARRENLAEPRHPLVGGRPGMPTRLMVGLHLRIGPERPELPPGKTLAAAQRAARSKRSTSGA